MLSKTAATVDASLATAAAQNVLERLTVSYAQLDSQPVVAIYRELGAVIVKQLIGGGEIEVFRNCFQELLSRRLESLGHPPTPDELDIDALYGRLAALDPVSCFDVRGIAKDHIEFYKFLVHPRVLRVVALLLGHDRIQINQDVNLCRIDSPRRDLEGFEWHQDYPYNVMSKSTVTTWMPLTPLIRDMGYLRIVPESHTQLHPVEIDLDEKFARYTQHRRMRIKAVESLADDFERRGVELSNIEPGDVLFFHSHMVHASSANRSSRNRWTLNARFGDVLDTDLVTRRWRVMRGRDLYPVLEIHPEYAQRVGQKK